jgi:Tol biopolymer transport system component
LTSHTHLAAVLALCALGGASPGCRDDVDPFEADDRLAEELTTGQLTFSIGDDRSPTWSQAGDSIYYSAAGYGHLPPDPGVLVGLPAAGGPSRPILSNVQLPNTLGLRRWFVAPAVSPAGEVVAFAEIVETHDLSLFCNSALSTLVCDPTREAAELPPLGEIAVRIRRLDATRPLDYDPHLLVPVPGLERVEGPNPYDAGVFHIVDYFPFQYLFDQERSFIFRASWSPDADRLVLSDGLRLLIWTASTSTVTTLPGGEDGVGPAWSPDGEWIAFSRLERADSSQAVCLFLALGVSCAQERTDYTLGSRTLTIVRPDGTGLAELAAGDEPAWSPDSRTVYFRRDDQIWSIGLDRTALAPVPGTVGGREPAVSPDGKHLAFSLLSHDGDYDIWIVSLVP